MDLDLYTTTPQSVKFEDGRTYSQEVKRIASCSEEYGYRGILVYSDNRLADPWTVADMIISETDKLMPMIALQPVYMHPYTVAKKIASIALLYDRAIALNLVAGGFRNDLFALGDHTPHDRRYERLTEYTEIIQLLLRSDKAVTYEGKYYQVSNLKLQPKLPEHLFPAVYLSGSSEAARKSALRLGAKLIEYPQSAEHYNKEENMPKLPATGIRIGILARSVHDKAWQDAHERFPKTRIGKLTHELAKNVSDSEWHKRLSEQNGSAGNGESVYWLGPFEHYHTFCPYLVGDYDEVVGHLSRYIRVGYTTCILDIPVSESELQHTSHVFQQAFLQAQEEKI